MKHIELKIISDPGHAWALIHEDKLNILGLTLDDFSPFSKRSKDGVCALEEDRDLAILLHRLKTVSCAYELEIEHTGDQALYSPYVRSWASIHHS